MDARLAMTQKAGAWLTERLTGLRKKLEESEKALQQFRERERIIDAKGVAQSGASKQLEQLAGGLVSARQKKAEAEAAYLQVQSAQKSSIDIESIPAIQKSPIYLQLKSVESGAERLQRVGLGVPDVLAAVRALRALGMEFMETEAVHTERRGAISKTYLGSVVFELVYSQVDAS